MVQSTGSCTCTRKTQLQSRGVLIQQDPVKPEENQQPQKTQESGINLIDPFYGGHSSHS